MVDQAEAAHTQQAYLAETAAQVQERPDRDLLGALVLKHGMVVVAVAPEALVATHPGQ
jgi:hypothetical protein